MLLDEQGQSVYGDLHKVLSCLGIKPRPSCYQGQCIDHYTVGSLFATILSMLEWGGCMTININIYLLKLNKVFHFDKVFIFFLSIIL